MACALCHASVYPCLPGTTCKHRLYGTCLWCQTRAMLTRHSLNKGSVVGFFLRVSPSMPECKLLRFDMVTKYGTLLCHMYMLALNGPYIITAGKLVELELQCSGSQMAVALEHAITYEGPITCCCWQCCECALHVYRAGRCIAAGCHVCVSTWSAQNIMHEALIQ